MHELTLSPMYGALFSNYLRTLEKKLSGELEAEGEISQRIDTKKQIAPLVHRDPLLSDVNDAFPYSSRLSQVQIENLIKRIMHAQGDMSFGIEIGRNTHPSDYGTVGYTLMNCSTLHQVFGFAMRYKHASNKCFAHSLSTRGRHFCFTLTNHAESDYLAPIIEFDFASIVHLSRFFVGGDKAKLVKPQRVNFMHFALTDTRKYQDFFGCPVAFNQKENEIIIPKSVFELPIRSANPKLFRLMVGKVAQQKKALEGKVSLKQKVKQHVYDRVGGELPTVISVANDFNMGVSTFKKHLSDEQTNYTKVCDEVRKNIALKLIMCEEKNMADISAYLGFSNSSTFNRAFKRWTNMSPLIYKKRLTKTNK